MIERIKWTPTCIYCGMTSGGTVTNTTGKPPTYPPRMSGNCPSSPDKKHKPRWEGY